MKIQQLYGLFTKSLSVMKNLLIFLTVSMFVASCNSNAPKTANQSASEKPAAQFTLAMYDQINIGMNMAEVVAVMKKDGVLLTQATSSGNETGAGKVTAKIYTWTNPDGSYIEVTFVEGISISKNKVNL